MAAVGVAAGNGTWSVTAADVVPGRRDDDGEGDVPMIVRPSPPNLATSIERLPAAASPSGNQVAGRSGASV